VKEEKKREGRVRKNPEILVKFFWRPSFTANLFLYHKPKRKEARTKEILTINSVGELAVALETIYDEWKRQIR
jgi:hypothetical protein